MEAHSLIFLSIEANEKMDGIMALGVKENCDLDGLLNILRKIINWLSNFMLS